ncbi:MAG: phenylalanine--tRNA ligase subunit beta [Gammaproteobacteria bacterium]|nr:phenylalanine--tRNA ligase subunit beta [Gammaproteobacteria bacterium]
MKIDMAWLREWCDPDVGDEALAHQLTMAGVEVDDLVSGPGGSAVLELALTPNRADCFSVRGVAREVSALFSAPLSARDVAETPASIDARRDLGLVAPEACPRFAGRVIEGLDPAAETPEFIKKRLAAAGERPQHLLVDVTNYVMLEMGQPMHAYDLERLNGGLCARWAEPGESLTLLDGTELKLESDVLVIADESQAVAAAGIMGGLGSAVDDGTSDVLLESAFFAPVAVAGRARRLGLQTEASLRFERGVDPSGQVEAIERATELIVAAAGGKPGPVIDSISEKDLPGRGAIDLRRGRLSALLGVALPDGDVSAMLRRLTMAVEETEAGWRVTPPSFRFDLAVEADLVEEIARIHGYENIPETPANWSAHPSASTERQVDPDRVRALLVDRGYHECLNYSFLDEESHKPFHSGGQELELANPLSGELSVLRRSLWPGLLRNYRTNRDRGTTDARLFEIGVCFSGTPDDIREETWLAGLLAGGALPEQWGAPRRDADFFDARGDVEAILALDGPDRGFEFRAAGHTGLRPGRSVRVLRGQDEVGWVGELYPELADGGPAPQLFALRLDAALESRAARVAEVSRFPAVRRDLSLVAPPSVQVGDLLGAIRAEAGELLREVIVFDVYEDRKSLNSDARSVGLGLIFQSISRTLTDAEVDRAVADAVSLLVEKFGVSVRQ